MGLRVKNLRLKFENDVILEVKQKKGNLLIKSIKSDQSKQKRVGFNQYLETQIKFSNDENNDDNNKKILMIVIMITIILLILI